MNELELKPVPVPTISGMLQCAGVAYPDGAVRAYCRDLMPVVKEQERMYQAQIDQLERRIAELNNPVDPMCVGCKETQSQTASIVIRIDGQYRCSHCESRHVHYRDHVQGQSEVKAKILDELRAELRKCKEDRDIAFQHRKEFELKLKGEQEFKRTLQTQIDALHATYIETEKERHQLQERFDCVKELNEAQTKELKSYGKYISHQTHESICAQRVAEATKPLMEMNTTANRAFKGVNDLLASTNSTAASYRATLSEIYTEAKNQLVDIKGGGVQNKLVSALHTINSITWRCECILGGFNGDKTSVIDKQDIEALR